MQSLADSLLPRQNKFGQWVGKTLEQATEHNAPYTRPFKVRFGASGEI